MKWNIMKDFELCIKVIELIVIWQNEHRQILSHSMKFNTQTWKLPVYLIYDSYTILVYSVFLFYICLHFLSVVHRQKESVISFKFICLTMEFSVFIFSLGFNRNYIHFVNLIALISTLWSLLIWFLFLHSQ